MATKFFYISSLTIDNLSPPRDPAKVQWVRNDLELSWQPPQESVNTNDLEYIVEVEQNQGWSTLGITSVPRIVLVHLKASKNHRFKIYAKNRLGMSEPLILENLSVPPTNFNGGGLAIEEVFDDNTSLMTSTQWQLAYFLSHNKITSDQNL
jgi:hypothetical protein